MNLTVEDILSAQERFAKYVDKIKTCNTCKYKDVLKNHNCAVRHSNHRRHRVCSRTVDWRMI